MFLQAKSAKTLWPSGQGVGLISSLQLPRAFVSAQSLLTNTSHCRFESWQGRPHVPTHRMHRKMKQSTLPQVEHTPRGCTVWVEGDSRMCGPLRINQKNNGAFSHFAKKRNRRSLHIRQSGSRAIPMEMHATQKAASTQTRRHFTRASKTQPDRRAMTCDCGESNRGARPLNNVFNSFLMVWLKESCLMVCSDVFSERGELRLSCCAFRKCDI